MPRRRCPALRRQLLVRLAWRVPVVVSPLGNARFPVPLEWGRRCGPKRCRGRGGWWWRFCGSGVAVRGRASEIELCASEVIANALVHTKDRCVVTVRRLAGRVRVEVADRCPELRKQERDAESASGRGLLLVEALTQA
ncbi:ATP-binding protein [Kitasatospora sp. NPDC047058]|uniref:ATP-binding protein n=1 Tax=Kitasatospora sp. NPDC047058 TaxID=3155620 RepID=UPI0033C157C6